jgi:hypothetical protein
VSFRCVGGATAQEASESHFLKLLLVEAPKGTSIRNHAMPAMAFPHSHDCCCAAVSQTCMYHAGSVKRL